MLCTGDIESEQGVPEGTPSFVIRKRLWAEGFLLKLAAAAAAVSASVSVACEAGQKDD